MQEQSKIEWIVGCVMREYNYKKIDAFTSEKSLGNPAACVYLEDDQTLE